MKTIKVRPNQTLFDIALEQYGTCEAVGEILSNNPSLVNDPAALSALGVELTEEKSFYLDAALEPGTQVEIDTSSHLREVTILRNLNKEINTYD